VASVDNLNLKDDKVVVHDILDPMFQEGIYEGLVFKEDSKAFTRTMKKLRLEYFKKYEIKLKKEPKKKKKARKKSIEAIIFEHFAQGYPELPWLPRGIKPEEAAELNKQLERLKNAVEKNENISGIVGDLIGLLVNFVLKAISSERTKERDRNKLEKAVKSYIGKQIGKMRKL